MLAQRVASGEQFFLGFRTDHRDAGALYLVFQVVEASLLQLEGADVKHVGIIAGDREIENPGVVLDVGLLADFGSDVGDLGKIGGKRFDVFLGKADWDSRLLAARLHGSPARNHDHQLGAEIGKDVGAGLAEAIAVGQQHDHRGDAPGHAEHGERSAAAVVPHRARRLRWSKITKHLNSITALLLPQRFHWLQHGRFARGIKARNHSGQRQAANRQHGRHRHQFRRIKSSRPLHASHHRH